MNMFAESFYKWMMAASKERVLHWTNHHNRHNSLDANLERRSFWTCSLCKNIWFRRGSSWISKWYLVSWLLIYMVWSGTLFFFYWHDILLIFDSYGLGAAVMSKDSERCERFSKVRVRLSFLCTKSLHEIKGSILIIMNFVFLLLYSAVPSGRNCLDQLLTTILHSGSMGRH